MTAPAVLYTGPKAIPTQAPIPGCPDSGSPVNPRWSRLTVFHPGHETHLEEPA